MYRLMINLFLSSLTIAIVLSSAEQDSRLVDDEHKKAFDDILVQMSGNGKKTVGMYGQFNRCDGIFSRIQWDVIDQQCEWKCDHLWAHTVNTTVNGYRNNVRICMDLISQQIVEDIKGNETYYSVGTVLEGECSGSQVVVMFNTHIEKGNCHTGVTELYSKKYSAMVAVTGLCTGTCYGTVWTHYWPGKL